MHWELRLCEARTNPSSHCFTVSKPGLVQKLKLLTMNSQPHSFWQPGIPISSGILFSGNTQNFSCAIQQPNFSASCHLDFYAQEGLPRKAPPLEYPVPYFRGAMRLPT